MHHFVIMVTAKVFQLLKIIVVQKLDSQDIRKKVWLLIQESEKEWEGNFKRKGKLANSIIDKLHHYFDKAMQSADRIVLFSCVFRILLNIYDGHSWTKHLQTFLHFSTNYLHHSETELH